MWRLCSPCQAPLLICSCEHLSISSLDRLCDWTNWFCSITGCSACSWLHTIAIFLALSAKARLALYTLYTCTLHSRLAVAAENEHSVSGKVGERQLVISMNTDRVNIFTILSHHHPHISTPSSLLMLYSSCFLKDGGWRQPPCMARLHADRTLTILHHHLYISTTLMQNIRYSSQLFLSHFSLLSYSPFWGRINLQTKFTLKHLPTQPTTAEAAI